MFVGKKDQSLQFHVKCTDWTCKTGQSAPSPRQCRRVVQL